MTLTLVALRPAPSEIFMIFPTCFSLDFSGISLLCSGNSICEFGVLGGYLGGVKRVILVLFYCLVIGLSRLMFFHSLVIALSRLNSNFSEIKSSWAGSTRFFKKL